MNQPIDEVKALLHTVLFKLSGTDVTPIALIIFAVTLVISILIGNIARRATSRFLLRRGGPSHEGVAYASGRIIQYLIVALGAISALDTLGFSLQSLAALGAVLAVGIGFGLQNIAQNFASGIILLIERPVQKGDFINVGDTVGTVEDISMRATRIITRDGVQIIVPNSELVAGRVMNRSAPTPHARVRIRVGVAYGTEATRVRDVLLEVAKTSFRTLKEPPPTVYFSDFAESALVFDLAVWIDNPPDESSIASELRFSIDRAFRAAGIVMAFPQRDLHIVSGMEPLVEALTASKNAARRELGAQG
jgi:potassium efflux system protein